MIQLMFIAVYFLAAVGVLIFFLVVFWRFMKAHESIAESMKTIAAKMGNKSQA